MGGSTTRTQSLTLYDVDDTLQQLVAYEQGFIPYIPADRKADKPE